MRRIASVLVLSLSVAAPALHAGAVTGLAAGSGDPTAPTPSVVRDVQAGVHELPVVGEQQADTAIEPSLAVNPENPDNVVIGYQAGRIDAHCSQVLGYGVSFDAGRTWEWGPVPKLTQAVGGAAVAASDAVVTFGLHGTVYFSSLLCSPHELATSVSHDGGRTWSEPYITPSSQTFDDDKNWIVVDNGTGPGHHPGRVYLMADDGTKVYVLYSDDEARTWNGPSIIYPGPGIGTLPFVLANGDLAVVFNTLLGPPRLPADGLPADPEADFIGSDMVIVTAPGAGAVATGGPLVFGPPLTVGGDDGNATPGHRAGDGLPTAALHPVTGRLYVAWQDTRYRTDTLNDIVISWSDDSGVTWTVPRPVNPGPRDDLVEHFTPAVGVGADGIVRLAYRTQFRGTNDVDTYYQQSTDGGLTWGAPLKLNTGLIPEYLAKVPAQSVPVRSDVRFAAFSRGGAFLGDYNQMGVAGSWAYVVRTESYRLSSAEPAAFPPKVHHQRAWVAVVDADGNGLR